MSKRTRRAPAIANIKLVFTLLALLAGALLWLAAQSLLEWGAYPSWLLSMSVVTFLLYGFDKLQAQRQEPRLLRVPEITLHVAAIAGGFMGAWAGMLLFRHKTRHQLFTIVLLASTVAHAVLAYLLLLR